MSEHTREEPQIGFRVREEDAKEKFQDALDKQRHIANATLFFQSAMDALCEASNRDELVEWPLEFVTKKKR